MPANSRSSPQQFSAATAVYARSAMPQSYRAVAPAAGRKPGQARAVSTRPPLPQLSTEPRQRCQSRTRSTDCINGIGVSGVGAGGRQRQLNGSNATVASSGRRRGSLPLHERGLVGLVNLGNTCYMNSILQCLSHTRPLLEEVMRSPTSGRSTGRLIGAYRQLMRDMWSSAAPAAVNPGELRAGVARLASRFRGHGQQDAQELLRYLLEGLHEDLRREPRPRLPAIDYQKLDQMADSEKSKVLWDRYVQLENSPIVDVFVGQLKSTLECCHCHHKSTTFDPFWDLALSIPRGSRTSLDACLDLFTTNETLDGNERPKCDACKTRRRCLKSFSLHRLPRILVIHLMRFSGDRYKTKLNTLVEYPLQLDLSRYVDTERQTRQCSQYSLYAVSQHSGTPYGGHYTAMARHAYGQPDRWLAFNDSAVSRGSAASAVSSLGYVLFYQVADAPRED